MPDLPVPSVAGVRVVDHAVLRVAAWPVEISDAFASPALAAAARAVLADRSAGVVDGSDDPSSAVDALAEAIHALVPEVEDRTTRRWLLSARRALRSSSQLVPVTPPAASGAVAHLPGGPALIAGIEAAGAPRVEAAERRSAFDAAFDDELRRARGSLRTLGSSARFRAALAIAEPSVLVRWEATRGKPLSDKARVRRLEATVLHFAMRACGRPTPNGGWAGIASVRPGDPSDPTDPTDPTDPATTVISTEAAPRQVHVSVDLVPFAAVLAAWAAELGAAANHPLRREPTLRDDAEITPDDEHRWVYVRRDANPGTFASLTTVVELRDAMGWWPPSGVATPAAFYERVGEKRGRAIVEHLLACGVLHSALQLPAFADAPADVLDAVTPLLPEPLAAAWRASTFAADTAARALAEAFLADDVAGVVRHRDEIHAAVSSLTSVAGLGVAPDRGLVHLDLGVPWRATWNAAGRAAAGAALDGIFAFHAADGSPEAYRQVMVDRVRATVAAAEGDAARPATDGDVLAGVAATAADWVTTPPAVTTRGDLLRAVGIDPDPAEARWAAQLDEAATAGKAAHELVLAPTPSTGACEAGAAGSFIVGVSGSTTWSRWGRPQPGMFVSRFAPLLRSTTRVPVDCEPDDGDRTGGVLTSLATTLRRIGARRIVGADAPNRNAALRPVLDGVDAWGWTVAGDADDPVEARVAEHDGTTMIVAADGDLHLPIYDSAAVIGSTDPVSRFVRTVAMTHGWELAAWGFPVLAAELDRWPSLPRLVVPASPGSKTVLAPRRWVVGGAALDAIRSEPDEAERYLAWRSEMDRRDIPARVIARWALLPDAPELVLMTESPLALRCLVERLPDGPATLVLSELPEPIDEWPVVGPEGHHLSELAVTWVRRVPALDAAVFPGGVVPSTFGTILDALDDADPAPARPVDIEAIEDVGGVATIERRCRRRFTALLDELVEPADRGSVARAAAAWLSRVADEQDPGGADSGADAAPAALDVDPAATADGREHRLRADLRALRVGFDRDLAAIAADGEGPDESVARTQLVARLAHIDTVARWGEGPDRLRREASIWRSLAVVLEAADPESARGSGQPSAPNPE